MKLNLQILISKKISKHIVKMFFKILKEVNKTSHKIIFYFRFVCFILRFIFVYKFILFIKRSKRDYLNFINHFNKKCFCKNMSSVQSIQKIK